MKVKRRGSSLPPSPPTEGWKPGELELRNREVAAAERTTRSQRWVQLVQALAVAAALASTFVAAVAARQSNEAAQAAAQASALQNNDSQLTSAISSLDVGDSTVRAARMLLIGKEITGIMTLTLPTSEARQDAYSDYTTTLQALSVLIRTQTTPATQEFGLGYGTPPPSGISIDIQYADYAIVRMLELSEQVSALSDVRPALDLSNGELYQQNLSGMNLSWINAFMVGIDLRGTAMESVDLSSRDDLASSHLQCTDLRDAHLQGADLEYANLSGADLAGADLQGTDLAGANLEGADVARANFSGARDGHAKLTAMYGTAIGLPPGVVTSTAQPFSQLSCLANSSYWDAPPRGF
jgi:hypothetical protein